MNGKKLVLIAVAMTMKLTLLSQQLCPVIPRPARFEKQEAAFYLSKFTPVVFSDERLRPVAYYLQKEILRTRSLPLSLHTGSSVKEPDIYLTLSTEKDPTGEGYSLRMREQGITISANSVKGAFYGVVSVLQIVAQSPVSAGIVSLPCWNIADEPLYSWRGLMLDESRHFFGKEKVKSLLDWMAFYKLNRFHWHLTDEPGWRLEIKKYPLLTLVGGIGNHTDRFAAARYYTQEDIKEIISYASERQIMVIPEIDMPGHATAANRAYPQYSGGGSAKYPEFTFHPGKDETYSYLTDILRETNALFPGGMLHAGGDEVSFGNEKWSTDPAISKLMREQKLASVKEVEQYFMRRMADSIFKMNATLLVWDEMAEVKLPSDKTIIFWWRHDKPEQLNAALQNGYRAVLCPRLPLYFDFVQDSTHSPGRKWNNLYNSLQNVYDFSASSIAGLNPSPGKQIVGIQANLWTETIPGNQRLDFMLFPRLAALAEAAWVPDNNKNYRDFTQKLTAHFALYRGEGILYFDPGR